MNKTSIPFGLLFEELPSNPARQSFSSTIYNRQEGLSYIADSQGGLVPFVTYAWLEVVSSVTGTTTKSKGDEEDTDYFDPSKPTPISTVTVTEAKETTDTD